MRSFLFGVMLSIVASVPAFAQVGCSLGQGGEYYACMRMLRQPNLAGRAGPLVSFSTMAIRNSSCINANSRWGFHGAYFGDERGNFIREDVGMTNHMRGAYGRGLSNYLDSIGALRGHGLTWLSGSQVAAASGKPLCR